MVNGASSRKTIFASLWISGILLLLLCLPLSSCGITLFSVNCVGTNVSCNTPTPTPDRPALLATAQAIMKGTPLLRDPLSQPDSNKWGVHSLAQKSCTFHDGAYFLTNSQTDGDAFGCDSMKQSYTNAAIQVDITLFSGDSAGIIFRVDSTFSEMYTFEITKYGEADIRLFGPNGSTTILAPARTNPAIYGPGKKNTLLAIIKGNDLQIFVNGAFISEARDNTLTTGFLGMDVSAYSENAKASFSNLAVYPV
ncbi:MAG TPA: family 16 glycoside hydrolase [Ktedonobacteraceae bacterium]|nr:family 16 glycoside hydrolase [Ktedonobacteraceae bacterium]